MQLYYIYTYLYIHYIVAPLRESSNSSPVTFHLLYKNQGGSGVEAEEATSSGCAFVHQHPLKFYSESKVTLTSLLSLKGYLVEDSCFLIFTITLTVW